MTEITITDTAVATVISEVAAWGERDVETGGFLLAGDDSAVSRVALAGSTGIHRDRAQFVVSGRALAILFAFANEHDLAILAQFHSHRGRAFLSRTDLRHGFSVDGFITTVLPGFASPPGNPAAWGWWSYHGEWIPSAPAAVAAGDAQVVRFDEDGARAS